MKTKIMFGFILALSVIFIGCKKNDTPDVPKVSFEKSTYEIPTTGSVVVRLIATNYSGRNVSIPFTLTGSAVKGEDYTVSAESFTIGADKNTAEITITSKNYEKLKDIKLTLGTLPAGLSLGTNASTVITVHPKEKIYYTFEKSSSIMSTTVEVTLILTTPAGAKFTAEEDIILPIAVEKSSTAIEGLNFTFDGAKQVLIPKGRDRAGIKIQYKAYTGTEKPGTDLVLEIGKLPNPMAFAPGQNMTTKISIYGPIADKLRGTWAGVSLFNFKWLTEIAQGAQGNNFDKIPKNVTAADKLEIGDDGLKITLTGDLKNYFRNSELSFVKEDQLIIEDGGLRPLRVQAAYMKLNKANVYFSPTQEKIRAVEIVFYVFTEAGKTYMDVLVRDFEPTDFMKATYDFWVQTFPDEKPAMKGIPLQYRFVKEN